MKKEKKMQAAAMAHAADGEGRLSLAAVQQVRNAFFAASPPLGTSELRRDL